VIYRLDRATYCKQSRREVPDRCLAVFIRGKILLETYKHCRSLGTIKLCQLCARPVSASGFVSEAPAADPARCLRRCLFRPPRRTPTRKICSGRSSRTAFSNVIARLWTQSSVLEYWRILLRCICVYRLTFQTLVHGASEDYIELQQAMLVCVRPRRKEIHPERIGMHLRCQS
jgi:hypothetical protein